MPTGSASITSVDDTVVFSHAYVIGMDDNGGHIKEGRNFTLNYSTGGLTGFTNASINGVALSNVSILSDTKLQATAPTGSLKHNQEYELKLTSASGHIGYANLTEDADSLTGVASASGSAGVLNLTEDNDTLTGVASAVGVSGVLDATEDDEVLIGVGNVENLVGNLLITEDDDTLLATAIGSPVYATATLTEAADSLTATARARTTGNVWEDELKEDNVWTDVE